MENKAKEMKKKDEDA